MNFFLYLTVVLLILRCFITAIVSTQDSAHLTEDISLNCGSAGIFSATDGRKWVGDGHAQISSSIRIKGSSTISSPVRGSMVSADQTQYRTARISRSQFSYAFQLKPGPKCIRLHFNPVSYLGFQNLKDLFTVEVDSFILLGNFSASLTADALGVKSFVKEFCVSFEENQSLNLILYPDPSIHSKYGNYAFINGIEIVSLLRNLSFFLGGVQMVGSKSIVHLDDLNFALEIVHRQNIRSSDDFVGTLGMKETVPNQEMNKISNITWNISVDVGFRYLIRLHFNQIGLKMAESNHVIFKILVNEIVADTSIDLFQERNGQEFPQYKDYMMVLQGHRVEGRRHLLISLESSDEFVDRNGPVKGFEISKLNNFDNNLASPNPLPQARDSPSQTLQNFIRVFGSRNIKVAATIVVIALVNIIVHAMRKVFESDPTEEERKPSDRAQRLCHLFSLAEMQYATKDFHHEYIIGKGGFGKVYKGFIDNGQVTVAIKRLKYSSRQGAPEFWTEIETLSELRHINLVSLIGYCNEQTEMMLVYEYMTCGTLADHIYKRDEDNIHSSPLSWKQLLNICIGAARGLDYLHTGLGIIHRDVKSSNILLDENFVAKISDFGLAKPEGKRTLQSHVSTNVKGTFGFLDPYYFKTRKLTRKSDVYAFGAVLLEVMCGGPVIDPKVEEDKRSLTIWAVESISKGEADSIISSNLRGEISKESLKAFVRIAQSCLDDEPKKRPTMGQVVLQLEFALELQNNPTSSVPNEIGIVDGTMASTSTGKLISSAPIDADSSSGDKHERKQLDASVISGLNEECISSAKPSTMNLDRITEISEDLLQISTGTSHELDVFTYEEMKMARNPFWRVPNIYDGNSLIIYRGVIDENVRHGYKATQVAITELDPKGTGVREWLAEITFLGQLRHPNLMKLIGYCCEDDHKLLVHEYMANGAVERHLFARESVRLTWYKRLKIALGAAKGLAFIHSLEAPIIHRDFKTANILLDAEFNAKLSNFRQAKDGPTEPQTHVSTRVIGTHGYWAPEYIMTGFLTTQADVYAFGVVLLEMLTGRRALDSTRPSREHNLVEWARPLLNQKKKLFNILDPRIDEQYSTEIIMTVAGLTYRCLNKSPKARPLMNMIVEILKPLVAREGWRTAFRAVKRGLTGRARPPRLVTKHRWVGLRFLWPS